jgi:hypothetical protein
MTDERVCDTIRKELAVIGQLVDALEPLSGATRLRVLAAVATLQGFDDIATRALAAAGSMERAGG